jgi:predicted protein tyrosine phosphatase
MITVCSLQAARQQVLLSGARHVISILSPPAEFPLFAAVDRHLCLDFHDVASATPGLTAPGAEDMRRLLAFLLEWNKSAPLVIHCWAGISRSTATAYIASCLYQPERSEEELAQTLRTASPSATPNPMLVALADDMLERDGRMCRAIARIGRGSDAYEGAPFTLSL